MSISKEITDPRIQDIVHEVNGGRVLDIGCVQHDPGKRHDPNWLHQHLYEPAESVLGVDRDIEGVEKLQEAGYNVVTGDAEVLDIDGQYDYVVAGELIEHLSNPGEFLESVKDRLTDGGCLILTTRNVWCWARLKYLIQEAGVPCNPEHTRYHDEVTLRQLLERHGYHVNIKYVGPVSEGITRWLHRMPVRQLKRLGSTQLLAVAEVN
jgi:2-polyprenyl-3-methyl-5-hydroxy-6-metoxy-1,4-benzoquinol methylase